MSASCPGGLDWRMPLPAAGPLGLHVLPALSVGFTGTHRGPAKQCPVETCRVSISGGVFSGTRRKVIYCRRISSVSNPFTYSASKITMHSLRHFKLTLKNFFIIILNGYKTCNFWHVEMSSIVIVKLMQNS